MTLTGTPPAAENQPDDETAATMSASDAKSDGPTSSPPSRSRRKRLVACVAAVAAIAASGAGGWLLNDAFQGDERRVSVTDTFKGTVTLLNVSGTSGCVQPLDGGRKVCSIFATLGRPVNVGDTVYVANEQLRDSRGNGYDWLLIVPSEPPG